MTRMPGAVWRPVVNVHKNGVKEHRGLVLHVQEGNNSPFGEFNNPASQASSDFWVSKTGTIEQYVETGTDYSWTQAAGNPYYASVETEGYTTEPLTAAQIAGVARIYAWGHKQLGWPLTVVDSTTAHGLTYHGVGGAAWGGHVGCPGELRKAQRALIIAAAGRLVTPTLPPPPPPPKPAPKPGYPKFPAGIAPGKSTPSARELQKLLKATSWLAQTVPLSDTYGPLTQAAVAGFNAKHGLNDVGVPKDPTIGPKGWSLLCKLALG